MFQSSSNAIPIIHNYLYCKKETTADIFILRSLIESFAAIKMLLAGDVSKESEQFIQEYSYIAEHEIYHRYSSLDSKLFSLKEIDSNFEKARKQFSDLGKLSVSDFNHLVESKMPFLLNHESFDSIIHPSDLLITSSFIKEESSNVSFLEYDLLLNLYQIILEKDKLKCC